MSPAALKALARLKRLLPPGELRFDKATREQHAGDKWFAAHLPDAVALPRTAKSVSALLKFANQHRIPVTPRGAGFGYVGGCVPLRGGIALSLMRMNRIKEIHAGDFVAVVQPGVLTQTFAGSGRTARICFIRPTPPAARIAPSAATSPPTPAARAA